MRYDLSGIGRYLRNKSESFPQGQAEKRAHQAILKNPIDFPGISCRDEGFPDFSFRDEGPDFLGAVTFIGVR